MLNQAVNAQRRDQRMARELTGSVWGTVLARSGTTITLTLPDIDGGTHAWGPVPYLLANGPTAPAPAAGDDAFLHVDQDGEPAYAVLWT